jgi:hypothetical protein
LVVKNEKSDCVSTIALSWWRDSDYRERVKPRIRKCNLLKLKEEKLYIFRFDIPSDII